MVRPLQKAPLLQIPTALELWLKLVHLWTEIGTEIEKEIGETVNPLLLCGNIKYISGI
jgi:alpha-beta hydrolase superfamily lysophospholipase